jgi:hypothetical protein
MTPIEFALALVAGLALVVGAYAAFRRHNHVETGLRAQLDQALEENRRLEVELARVVDELHAAKLKLTPEKLSEHARLGVDYAQQVGGTPEAKLRHALAASIKSDKGANGVQDWTDAQHRIAIEAELTRRKR